MSAAPDVAAIWADVLLCLGLGLLLGAVRDAAGLLLGNGRLLCAVWDALALALAAVLLCGFAAAQSVIGTARWYMAAAMAAGAFGWYCGMSEAVHAVLGAALRLVFAPLRLLHKMLVLPLKRRIFLLLASIKQQILLKKAKKQKKLLQKGQKVLYN